MIPADDIVFVVYALNVTVANGVRLQSVASSAPAVDQFTPVERSFHVVCANVGAVSIL